MNTLNKRYRALDGRSDFGFTFIQNRGSYDIVCTDRPPLQGRDASLHRVHLHPDNRVCFVEGREPRSLADALDRARQWAEYYLRYVRTGEAEG